MTKMRALEALVAVFVSGAAGGCGSSDQTHTLDSPETVIESTTAAPPPTTPEPTAEPALDVTSSCDNDYPLVIEPSTHSLVATATVANSGSADVTADVTTEWFPVGQAAYTASKTVTVEPGSEVRVPFSEKVSAAVMNGMVGLQHGDQMCDVTVTPQP